jgi:hypothetical protein
MRGSGKIGGWELNSDAPERKKEMKAVALAKNESGCGSHHGEPLAVGGISRYGRGVTSKRSEHDFFDIPRV